MARTSPQQDVDRFRREAIIWLRATGLPELIAQAEKLISTTSPSKNIASASRASDKAVSAFYGLPESKERAAALAAASAYAESASVLGHVRAADVILYYGHAGHSYASIIRDCATLVYLLLHHKTLFNPKLRLLRAPPPEAQLNQQLQVNQHLTQPEADALQTAHGGLHPLTPLLTPEGHLPDEAEPVIERAVQYHRQSKEAARKLGTGDYTSDYNTSGGPYGDEDPAAGYPSDEGHTTMTDLDMGNSVDWADAGEFSEQGMDPQRVTNVGTPPMNPSAPWTSRSEARRQNMAGIVVVRCEVCDGPVETEGSACSQADICHGCHNPDTCEFCDANSEGVGLGVTAHTADRVEKAEDIKPTDISAGAPQWGEGSDKTLQSPATKALADQDLHLTPSDVKVSRLDRMTAAVKQAAEATAFAGEWRPKTGDMVKYLPTGREGKVTAMNERFAEVEFGDEAPATRSVSVNQLAPVEEADAETEEPVAEKAEKPAAPAVLIMIQEGVKEARLEQAFLKELRAMSVDKWLGPLERERRSDIGELRLAAKESTGQTLEQFLHEGGIQALLVQDEDYVDTLKFVLPQVWARVVRAEEQKTKPQSSGTSSPVRDETMIPEPVLRQVIREDEEKEQKGALSGTEEAEYGQYVNEESRRLTNVDPQKNHVKTYSLEKSAGTDWDYFIEQAEFLSDMIDDEGITPEHGADADGLVEDLQEVLAQGGEPDLEAKLGPLLERLEDEEPTPEDLQLIADVLRRSKTASLADAFAKAAMVAIDPDLEDRIADSIYDLKDVYEQGLQEGWAREEMAEQFAHTLGERAVPADTLFELVKERITKQAHKLVIGATKTAAGFGELPADLFSDEEFHQSERHLGAISLENLEEARPRMLSQPSNLINAASNTFRKAFKKLKGQFTLESVSLNKIVSDRIGDDGRMIKGALLFHVILAAHAHRRRAGLDLVVDVVDGEPQDIIYAMTSGGVKIAFNKDALDKVMHVRRDNLRPAKRYTRVQRSCVDE